MADQVRHVRWRYIIGWSVSLAILAAFLDFLAPPQPRCTLDLPKGTVLKFLSDDGTYLITWKDLYGPVGVWNTYSGESAGSFLEEKKNARFQEFAVSSNHRFLAIKDNQGFLHLLDLVKRREHKQDLGAIGRLGSVEMRFSPGKQLLLVRHCWQSRKDEPAAYMIETETGEIAGTIRGSMNFHGFSGERLVYTTPYTPNELNRSAVVFQLTSLPDPACVLFLGGV